MKRTAVMVAFGLFVSSLALTAQSAGKFNTTPLVVHVVPSGVACPIGMQARHEFFFHRELVDGSRQPGDEQPKDQQPNDQGTQTRKDQGMQLKLTLTPPPSNRIVGARVTVRGLNGKGQDVRVDSGRNGSAQTSTTLDLDFSAGAGRSVSSDLRLPGFTSVSSIQLDSVTYADGSTWRFAPHNSCTVAPEPLMLIGD